MLPLATDSGSSYFGSLEFLDFQSKFDRTFPNPTPLFVTSSPSKLSIPLPIDSTSVSLVIHYFVDQCKFQVFLPIYHFNYVGTANHDDAASLHATVQILKKFAMSFRNPASDQWINLIPDELFDEYANLAPLLPPKNVSLWGLNLVTQFHDAFPLHCNQACESYRSTVLSNLMLSINFGSLRFAITTLRKLTRSWLLRHTRLPANWRLVVSSQNGHMIVPWSRAPILPAFPKNLRSLQIFF